MNRSVKPLFILLFVLALFLLVAAGVLAQINVGAAPGAPITQGTVVSTINVSDTAAISVLKVSVSLTHSHSGDLTIRLRHAETNTSVTLLQKLGSGLTFGCSANAINVTFDDTAGSTLDSFDCSGDANKNANGSYRPTNGLGAFVGQSAAGNWVLEVIDNTVGDDGTLQSWSLIINDGTPGAVSSGGSGYIDGRVNNRLVDLAAPVAIYCGPDGSVKVYDIVDSRGALAFVGEPVRGTEAPKENTRIASGMNNELYYLTSGELQVQAAGLWGEEGKIYTFIWKGC